MWLQGAATYVAPTAKVSAMHCPTVLPSASRPRVCGPTDISSSLNGRDLRYFLLFFDRVQATGFTPNFEDDAAEEAGQDERPEILRKMLTLMTEGESVNQVSPSFPTPGTHRQSGQTAPRWIETIAEV